MHPLRWRLVSASGQYAVALFLIGNLDGQKLVDLTLVFDSNGGIRGHFSNPTRPHESRLVGPSMGMDKQGAVNRVATHSYRARLRSTGFKEAQMIVDNEIPRRRRGHNGSREFPSR
jgi:hypothetical protein